jgi:hypothetical protein
MEKVLSSTMLAFNVLDFFLFPKNAQATQDLMDGIHIFLLEIKQCNSNIKLTTKHCILRVAIIY